MNKRKLAIIVTVALSLAALLVALGAPVHADSPTEPVACPTPIKPNWRIKGNCGTNPSTHFLGTTDNQPLVFKTNKLERMRLLTNGNVGIGTNSPASKLTVAGLVQSTGGGFKFPDNTVQTTAATGFAGWSLTGNAGTNPATNFLGTKDNTPLILKTDNTEQVRILNNGNVGIGTDTPNQKLEVAGNVLVHPTSGSGVVFMRNRSNTNYSQLVFQDDSGTERGYLGYIGSNGGFGARNDTVEFGTVAKDLTLRPNDAEVMRLTQDGRVGIGTTTPCTDTKLHVYAASSGIGCIPGAVLGENNSSAGVVGFSNSSYGVHGISSTNSGVYGQSTGGGNGVYGESFSGTSVFGKSVAGTYIFEGWDSNTNLRFAVERATGNVKADGSFSGPADFAEMMPVAGSRADFTVGDVLVIGPDGTLTRSDKPNATNLAGVYSAKPGFLGDTEIAAHGIEYADASASGGRIAVGLIGIMPVKVTDENGTIHPGDLLTTSSTPGHAMKAKPVVVNGVEIYPTGTILGRALEGWTAGSGLIQVLITLR